MLMWSGWGTEKLPHFQNPVDGGSVVHTQVQIFTILPNFS